MAKNIQSTKRRLKSITATKKITNAMKLVATAKLNKSIAAISYNNLYIENLLDCIYTIAANCEDKKNNYFTKKRDAGVVYIVFTSSLGLCSGYNNNVLKVLEGTIDYKKDSVIIFGKKGINYLNAKNIKTIFKLNENDDIKLLSSKLMTLFNNLEISDLKVIYTKYINPLTYEVRQRDLLPLNKLMLDNRKTSNIIFEPEANELLELLVPMYIEGVINNCMQEATVSEHASRRLAMDNATKNAEELIEKLLIEYNKVRQANITQEISEIVSSS